MINKLLASVIIFISCQGFSQDHTWIQYDNTGALVARVITENTHCPKINIDGKSISMNLRTSLDDSHLKQKVIVCEYNVNENSNVKINNKLLNLPPEKINRIAIIGDTGCEYSVFESAHQKQICDSENWPFKKIADKVALLSPDFVIHVGDYVYLNKHKTSEDKIKNSTMQWNFFKKDFFDPARNLLEASPMLFVRGNHESCDLAGDGWFSFLAPGEFSQCKQYTPSYNLTINDLNFIMFDSSGSAKGDDFSEDQLQKYKEDFAKIYKNITTNHWLLTHHPVITLKKLSDDETFLAKLPAMVIEKAFKSEYSNKIPVSIAGHYHVMALTERPSTNFSQLIVGNGGTRLHQAQKDSYNITSDDGKDHSMVRVRYGYMILDRLEDHLWKATSYDLEGTILLVTNLSTK